MLRQQARSAADEPSDSHPIDRQLALDLEAVRVRNYDHHEGHSVHVALGGADDESSLAERVYLGPGRSTRLAGPLDPGRYQLRVRIDGVERHRGDVQVDETSAGTAVIELGNGVVSVTEGA